MKNWSSIPLRKFRKLQHLLFFFGFQVTNNRLKMVPASPYDQKYIRYPLALKLNVTLARPLRLVNLYFLMETGACIFMTANETRDLMLMGSPIQYMFALKRKTS